MNRPVTFFIAFVALFLFASPAVAGEVWLGPDGNDDRDGRSRETAVASGQRAVELAKPGDRVRLAEGTYGPLQFDRLRGTADAPIVIAPSDDAPDRPADEHHSVRLTSGRLNSGTGLLLTRCEHVVVRGLEITNSQKGTSLSSCQHCRIEDNFVHQLGQEAIHVGRGTTNSGDDQFVGPASHHVQVLRNRVAATGRVTAIYGEGIYIGTGAILGDDSHDILIEDNVLSDISAEAIELKPGTTRLTVRGNQISDTHHQYNAAITVCVEGTTGPSGEYLIENNTIRDVRKVRYSVAAIAIGHGNATIRGNRIADVDGAGIQVYRRFQNPDALLVTIEGNTIERTAGPPVQLHHGNCGQGDMLLKATVTVASD